MASDLFGNLLHLNGTLCLFLSCPTFGYWAKMTLRDRLFPEIQQIDKSRDLNPVLFRYKIKI